MREKGPKHTRLFGIGMIDDFGDLSLQVTQCLDCRLLFAHFSKPIDVSRVFLNSSGICTVVFE